MYRWKCFVCPARRYSVRNTFALLCNLQWEWKWTQGKMTNENFKILKSRYCQILYLFHSCPVTTLICRCDIFWLWLVYNSMSVYWSSQSWILYIFQSLAWHMWELVRDPGDTPNGIYVEMSFIEITLKRGQALFTFCVFALDYRNVIKPFIKWYVKGEKIHFSFGPVFLIRSFFHKIQFLGW